MTEREIMEQIKKLPGCRALDGCGGDSAFNPRENFIRSESQGLMLI